MSYSYRERDTEYDDYSRRSDRGSSYKIKRYVVSQDDDRDREREVVYRRDDVGDKELVLRRKSEREDDYYRSERDYRDSRGHLSPRDDDYQIVTRSEAVDRDPRDREYYYQRRVVEYDDDRGHRREREISPRDSISQVSHRHDRGRDRDRDYSSDDSIVYIKKTTREVDDDAHHRRHLAEGALVGLGAAELLRARNKSRGRAVSTGLGRVGRDVGAGAIGVAAAEAISRYRSKSHRRTGSLDDDRHFHHHRRHRSWSRSRSRSSSNSRAKTLVGLGLGAAALAAGVALARKNNQDNRQGRSRSRVRDTDSGAVGEKRRSRSRSRRIAGAGLAGAAAAGVIEHVRSQSRSRKGETPHSRIRQALPVVAAGLGSAAIAGLYENRKSQQERDKAIDDGQTRSRSRSRSQSRVRSVGPSETFPDPARENAGLIEYGHDPMYGNIPAADYYGRPASEQGYYSDAVLPTSSGAAANGRRHRQRSRSRGASSGSDNEPDRGGRHRRRHKDKPRSTSRIRELAEAGLAAAGISKYAERKKKKEEEDRRRSRERDHRRRYEDRNHDTYEEPYDPAPYVPSPPPAGPPPTRADNYYPYATTFPPPPGPPPIAAEYPPPGMIPAPPHAPPPAGGMYSQQAPRGDENVSVPPTANHREPDAGLRSATSQSGMNDRASRATNSSFDRRKRSMSQPPIAQYKSVSFDLNRDDHHRNSGDSNPDRGYETDDSDSTIDGHDAGCSRKHHRSHRRRSSYSAPFPSFAAPHRRDSRSSHIYQPKTPIDTAKDSDSESTIELPDRFDAQGRPLPDKEDEHVARHFERLLHGFGDVLLDGRPSLWGRSR